MKKYITSRLVLCAGDERYHLREQAELRTFCGRFKEETVAGGGTVLNSYPVVENFKGDKPICQKCSTTISKLVQIVTEEYEALIIRTCLVQSTINNIHEVIPQLIVRPENIKRR